MNGNPFSDFLASDVYLPVGRTEILREIAQVITLPKVDSRDLIGLPGMGKSSLLSYVHSQAFIDAYRGEFFEPFSEQPELLFMTTVSGWLESVAPAVLIYRQYARSYDQYHQRLSDARPDLTLPAPPTDEVDDLDGSEAMSVMENHLHSVVQAGVRVVLLLDEFDSRWAFENVSPAESAKMGTWKKSLCCFILATERELIEVNPVTAGSPLYNNLPQTPVREMWDDDAKAFVRAILDQQGHTLPPQDIDRLLPLAGGFPYLLILAGRALWDFRRRTGLADKPDTPLPDTIHPHLMERLYDDFQRPFEQFYINRNPAQRQALLRLAEQGTILNKPTLDQPSIQLWGLEKYGLCNVNIAGQMTLFSPLFRQFLLAQGDGSAGSSPALPAESPQLTGMQAELYDFFRSKPGQVLSFEELGERVWAWSADYLLNLSNDDRQRIRIAVSKLRKELERVATGERIVNLRSLGYRFEPAG